MGLFDYLSELGNSYFAYFKELIAAYFPHILGSFAIIVIGWITALIVRMVLLRLFKGLNKLAAYGGLKITGHNGSTKVLADAIFWLLIIFTLILAAQNLGLQLLVQVLNYLPNFVLAGIIIFIGFVLGNVLHNIIENQAVTLDPVRNQAIATISKWLVVSFFVILGVDQLDINISLLSNLLIIAVAIGFACMGLSFVLGITDTLKNLLASNQMQKRVEIGRVMEFEGQKGKLIDYTNTHVIIETEEGTVQIPAQLFQKHSAILLKKFD